MISIVFLYCGWALGWRGYPPWAPAAAALCFGVIAAGLGVAMEPGARQLSLLPMMIVATGALAAAFAYVGYAIGRLARRVFGGGKRFSFALPQIGR